MKQANLFFTRDQSRRVDKLAIEAGTPGIVLMENAATGCAQVLMNNGAQRVFIFAGIGNNGGDGFAIARILQRQGVDARILICGDRKKITGDALVNLNRLNDCKIETIDWDASLDLDSLVDERVDWLVDAMLGTGASGDPRPPFDQVIEFINGYGASVLAIDIPSGLDCDTGLPGEPTVKADVTCTFVTQKIGFAHAAATPYLGDIQVIDIGVTDEIVEQIATSAPK